MPKRLLIAGAVLLAGAAVAETVFRDGFEHGFEPAWKLPDAGKEVRRELSEKAFSGNQAAKVTVVSNPERKFNRWPDLLLSDYIPAKQGNYILTGRIRFPEGFGASCGVAFYDQDKKRINGNAFFYGSKPASADWMPFRVKAGAYSEATRYVRIRISAPCWSSEVFLLDDLQLDFQPAVQEPPPWQPQYKLKKGDPLTAADVMGPDGIVYPDFSRAGVRNGLMERPRRELKLSDFGGRPGQECYDALTRAIASLPPEGGVIRFDEGAYRLGRFVRVTRDGVVLRGAGRGKTRILFDYDAGENGVDLYRVAGSRLKPGGHIHIYARPEGLREIRLTANGREIRRYRRSMHSGNESLITAQLPGDLPEGPVRFRAVAVYENEERSTEAAAVIDRKNGISFPARRPSGAILFHGAEPDAVPIRLAKDGKRGDRRVTLEQSGHGLRAGEIIAIHAPATERWQRLTRNACNWGLYRNYLAEVTGIEGADVEFDMPLRIDFPVIDGSTVQRRKMIRGCGVEDMSLEMKNNFWVTLVGFENAVDCWARNVAVYKCGRHPIYARNAKNCAILDCEFDDSFYHGVGGTAYAGWEVAYDCLMDNVTTRNLRHAPLVQWSAAGNVVRNSRFYGCDAHWHSGWTNENLFENCLIVSDTLERGGSGHWNTLTDELHHPIIGNAIMGTHCENTHVINELQHPSYGAGLKNVRVAACPDGILVCSKEHSEEIKKAVENLTPRLMYEERRWGTYRVLDDSTYEGGQHSLTKSITLNPGKNISYQIHHHRSEVWTFVEGKGIFVLNGVEQRVTADDTVIIPAEHYHAIKALSKLTFIEVQSGNRLVEEDIEKFEWNWSE